MKEIDFVKIMEELTEANLELTSLKMVLGILIVLSMALKIHPGSAAIAASISSASESVKDRISKISLSVDEKKPIVVQLREMNLANPTTLTKQ